MLNLNTNISDLILINTLNSSTNGLNNTLERLTTGFKINHAKDNAAGISIVNDLSKRISSLLQIRNNSEDGISLLSTAQGALENIQDLLVRLKALTVQAGNGNYSKQSRDAMQAEADAIIEQIRQIRENTEFNGLKLFEAPEKDDTTATAAVTRLAQAKVKTQHAAPSLQKTANSISTQSNSPTTTSTDSLAEPVRTAAPMATRAAAPARAASDTISGAIDFKGNETKTVTIDGVEYTFRNKENLDKTISYSKDKSSGELTLYINYMEVKGQLDVAHNIVIYGKNNNVYGGNLDDRIHVTGSNVSASRYNYIYGGAGNDNLSTDCDVVYMYGQDGDDTFTSNQWSNYAYGGNGNDTFYINGGGGSRYYGEDGEDSFYIASSATSVTVDGGSGTNYAENNSTSSYLVMINVPIANCSAIDFKAGETKTLTINGLEYTVKNNGSASTFTYNVNANGQIHFNTPSYTITGNANQKHNVLLKGSSMTYIAGNLGDTIVSDNSSNTIYGGNGDDNITISSYTTVFANGGNNTINISSRYNSIFTGNGNNTITIKNSTAGQSSTFEFGDGNNTIQNAQYLKNSSLYGGSGTNTLVGTPVNSLIYGFGDADNASFFNVPASGSSTLTINDTKYDISKTNSERATKLLYRQNSVTGEIEFGGAYLQIKGEADKSHNAVLQAGRYLRFYGGNLDDKISSNTYGAYIYGEGGNDTISSVLYGDNYIYGGDGDDNITVVSAHVYGGNGDDTITINGGSSAYIVNGNAGNDTYYVNANAGITDDAGDNIYHINTNNITITGGSGNDTFYANGNNNIILGGGGNDYSVIDGTGNTIDGGTGDNYYVDNGSGNNLTNTEFDPNSGSITFTAKDQVKSFVLDGKTYTVTNKNATNTSPASNQVTYSYNPNTGVITFNGSDVTIDGELSKSHKLNIRGNNNTINGGNLADTITVEQGSNNIINGLAGDDTINMNSENNAINGGDGNDTITLNASTNKLVSGGNGNDNLIVNSSDNTNIDSGTGNDNITINGANNTLKVNDGDNSVNVRNDGNTITATNGNNNFSVVGSSNTITAGSGNNKVGIDGDSNHVTIGTGNGDIDIYGENNVVSKQGGDNNVTINGNSNEYSSQSGDQKVKVSGDSNDVSTTTGNDNFEIRGNQNTITTTAGKNKTNMRGDGNSYQGGSGVDNITISGNNNTAYGGDSNDTFMISKGSNNIIDGNGGSRNTMVNNGEGTTFNGVVDITPHPFELALKVDLGTKDSSFINVSISFNLFDFYLDFSDPRNVEDNINQLDDLMSQVDKQLLVIGTALNRMESVMECQSIELENMLSTRSTLRDADVAKESSNFIKYQILQQAAATLMSSSRNLNANAVLGILNQV